MADGSPIKVELIARGNRETRQVIVDFRPVDDPGSPRQPDEYFVQEATELLRALSEAGITFNTVVALRDLLDSQIRTPSLSSH